MTAPAGAGPLREVLERMAGSWTGEIVHTAADGRVERATVRQTLVVSGATVRLTSVAQGTGAATSASYEGRFDGDDVVEFALPAGRLQVRAAGPSAILLHGDQGDATEIVEIISVAADGSTRSRVGMVTEHGVCTLRIAMTETRETGAPTAP